MTHYKVQAIAPNGLPRMLDLFADSDEELMEIVDDGGYTMVGYIKVS